MFPFLHKSALVVILLAIFSLLIARDVFAEEHAREVKTRVAPTFPDIARRMQISGKVRLEVTIAPDGHVKATHPLGGHPVLVDAATNAVKNWRFSTGTGDAKQIVEVDFRPADAN